MGGCFLWVKERLSESKIIGMYAKGLTTSEISDKIEDTHGFEATKKWSLPLRNWGKFIDNIKNTPVLRVFLTCHLFTTILNLMDGSHIMTSMTSK